MTFLHSSLTLSLTGRVPEMVERQQLTFDKLKDHQMKPRHGDAALVEIMRRGGLSGSQLAKAVAEWDRPCHDEHAEQGFTGWRLLNAVTEAIKPTGVHGMDLVRQKSIIASNFINEIAAS